MIGHQAIIESRRAGLKPATIFIDAFDSEIDEFWARNWREEGAGPASVIIAPSELVSGLDMRFVKGIPVLVTGDSESRVMAISRLCIDCGAKHVVAAFQRDGMTVIDVEMVDADSHA